jgi:predicted dithiol-disulfide oxidoreductase (DUF899 family)
MTDHRVATREQWQAARRELLELEKEHAERARELTRRRQELPWVAVGTDLEHDLREGPGRTAFTRLDGVVHHTYVRYAPGDLLEPFYCQLLDLMPSGRGNEFRVTRDDEYDDAS